MKINARTWQLFFKGWTVFLLMICISPIWSQTTGTDPLLKPADLEARIKNLPDNPEADEDEQKTLADFRDALRFSAKAEDAIAKTKDFLQKTKGAPGKLEALSEEIPRKASLEIPSGAPLEKIENLYAVAGATLAEAKAELKAKKKEAQTMVARQSALPGLIAKAKAELAALSKPETPTATGAEAEQASYQRYLAQRKLLKEEVAMFKVEMQYLETAPALVSAENGLLIRSITVLSENTATLRQRLEGMKLELAANEIARTRDRVERFPAGSTEKEIAEEVMNLALRHGGEGGMSRKIAASATELSAIQNDADRVEKQFGSAKERVQVLEEVGMKIDPVAGRLLRAQRQKLPSEGELRKRLRAAMEESAQTQIERLILEDRYSEILAKDMPDGKSSPELTELLAARNKGLLTLIQDHRDYLKNLQLITTEIRSLIETSSEFALFVDERLLWIPSLGPIRASEPEIEKGAYVEFFSSKPFAPLYRNFLNNPVLWSLAGIVSAVLIFSRRIFRAKLKDHGAAAAKRNCTSFTPTVLALFHTILLAAPIPLIAWFIYSRSFDCPQAVVSGLRSVAGFFTFAIFFRVLTHPIGLLVKHLRMEEKRVAVLRKGLNWFIPVMPVFLFFASALPNASGGTAGGRLTFIAVVIILMVLYEQVLRPNKKLVHWYGKPANHFAKACYLLALLVPLALIVGAAVGYYASVQELRLQALMSVAQILATLFVAGLLYRWILVSRRRFAVDQAIKRRAIALAEKENKESGPDEKPQNVASVDEVKSSVLKVVEVEEQTSRLVRAAAITVIVFGLIGIWQSAIPALSALDRMTLWEDTTQANAGGGSTVLPNPLSAISDSGSAEEKDTSDAGSPNYGDDGIVTLQDLLLSFVILFLTFIAARNIPGLLELAVFRHMNLALGSSFALTTSIRYLIVVVGIIMAFGKIGIDWGKVQWIAAAVTLGIGFGLQEIFANFVAGLIILFERPIRLGDIVTIAGVDGKVTQIRIRATTIRQFNNRELVVPNKEFITGQLVNWTLSDTVLRVDVPVGIAYGSDTELAHRLLIEAATANSRVLADPPPIAIFDAFADSSLAFILRVHISGIEDLLPAKSELHFAVDKAFREAGIEISFPQTDIHIKSMPPREKEQTSGSEMDSPPLSEN
jgi:potassium efflux system protein